MDGGFSVKVSVKCLLMQGWNEGPVNGLFLCFFAGMHWYHGSVIGIVTIFLIFGCFPLYKFNSQAGWKLEGKQWMVPSGISDGVERRLMAMGSLHEVQEKLKSDELHLHQGQGLGQRPIQHAPAHQSITFNAPSLAPNSPYAVGFPEISVVGHPRIRIRSTGYPFNVIGLMENGCTGTLVGPCHVLTAGHCIYSHDRREYTTKMGFAPGQNSATGSRVIPWKDFRVSQKWLWKEDFNADYAIVSLRVRSSNLSVDFLAFHYSVQEA